MKQKTLLLLTNNALTASFMRAWYGQNEDLYSEYNVIGILSIANVIEWLYLKNRNKGEGKKLRVSRHEPTVYRIPRDAFLSIYGDGGSSVYILNIS